MKGTLGFTTWMSSRNICATTRSGPLPSGWASSRGLSSARCFASSRKAVDDVTSHVDTLDFPVSSSATVLKPSLLQPRVVVYDGVCHLCHRAALKVMSYLPLPYSALSALLVIPRPLRDAVYVRVAKKRYDWFGKEDECLVMRERNMLDRFIDRDEILERSRTVL